MYQFDFDEMVNIAKRIKSSYIFEAPVDCTYYPKSHSKIDLTYGSGLDNIDAMAYGFKHNIKDKLMSNKKETLKEIHKRLIEPLDFCFKGPQGKMMDFSVNYIVRDLRTSTVKDRKSLVSNLKKFSSILGSLEIVIEADSVNDKDIKLISTQQDASFSASGSYRSDEDSYDTFSYFRPNNKVIYDYNPPKHRHLPAAEKALKNAIYNRLSSIEAEIATQNSLIKPSQSKAKGFSKTVNGVCGDWIILDDFVKPQLARVKVIMTCEREDVDNLVARVLPEAKEITISLP